MRGIFFVATAIVPAIFFAVAGIGKLLDPFPPAFFFASSLGISLQTGFAVARGVGIFELCLAVSLCSLLGRSRVAACLGMGVSVALSILLFQIATIKPACDCYGRLVPPLSHWTQFWVGVGLITILASHVVLFSPRDVAVDLDAITGGDEECEVSV